jgi:hypothetical protein
LGGGCGGGGGDGDGGKRGGGDGGEAGGGDASQQPEHAQIAPPSASSTVAHVAPKSSIASHIERQGSSRQRSTSGGTLGRCASPYDAASSCATSRRQTMSRASARPPH